jgi:hypothetical protein
MYDTSGTQSICHATFTDYNVEARVNWLKGELDHGDARRKSRLERRELDHAEAMRMTQPISNAEAFAWFGTFLGLFPPAAIFARVLERGIRNDADLVVLLFCIVMNAICCVVGRVMGGHLGGKFGDPRERAWGMTLLSAVLFALVWAVATGAAGGAPVVGIGAIFGAFCALPVALVGFPAFMLLHRLLSRGGMIEERHLWPLAFGVPCVIAAVIMSPSVFAH